MEKALLQLMRLALAEDIGSGDLTAQAVPADRRAKAKLIAKEDLVFSGSSVIEPLLQVAEAKSKITLLVKDGELVAKGAPFLLWEGPAREILSLERTLLNFLQRLCGIATEARRIALLVKGTNLQVLDTRKTTPGFRALEKAAVKDGGLHNHRLSLDTGILIKENHIRAAGGIAAAVKALGKQQYPIQVEVTNHSEVFEALQLGLRHLLLDNFSPEELKKMVQKILAQYPDAVLEASGGVTTQSLPLFAASGVHRVSMGALTHSVRAADISLLFELP